MIELALPAGSLETGLAALKNGADAVYFGLREFSARKGAVNFSIEDLSKIRRYSLENGKKIYITINTLVDDSSLERVIPLLDEVSFIGNDGIIIQDLGVASIIRKYYPNLQLHGSTQLAVHTTQGVKELQELGFERVVLSRELTLKEIEKIRKDCPDIELKAFIHGALCYGFSGLCSASFLKCGRSANGGECAQICRSWFTDNSDGENGYFFSMQDMDAGEKLLELNRMGIDSAKVEGRLKGPEYVVACAKYYRGILQRGYSELQEEDNVATSFQRVHGTGYLDYRKNRPSLLTGPFPGHMGLECAKVIRQTPSTITVRLFADIESHDGLQFLTKDRYGILQATKFSAIVKYRDRDTATLIFESREDITGKSIYKISDSTKKEKTQSTNLPLYRKPIEIKIVLGEDCITATALGKSLSKSLALQEARTPIDPKDVIVRHFSESGESRYTLGNLVFENNSSMEYPFLPPSIMKDFRRDFYALVDTVRTESPVIEEVRNRFKSLILPDRKLLSKDLPWSLEPTVIEDRTYFTFPPVTFDEEALFNKALENFNGYEKVTIGLNNISQVRFAKQHPEFDYFADIFLYLSNRFTADSIADEVPNLIGGYLWFERQEKQYQWPFEPTIVKDFEPPVFISRTCYRHDAKGESCTGCTMIHDYSISQAPDSYTVKVRNCLTVVTRHH